VCWGPDFSNISVLPDGALQIHGLGGVARSSDGGRTWKTVAGMKQSTDPFWKRSFKGPDGFLYQNLIVNNGATVIFSKDEGKTWEQRRFPGGPQTLVLWTDASSIFIVNGSGLYSDFNQSIAKGQIDVLQAGSDEPVGRYNPLSERRFVGFNYDGWVLTYARPGEVLKTAKIGQFLTGFFVAKDNTIFISTGSTALRGRNLGQHWEELSTPPGWVQCNGDPPRAR
jgi:hypothetical protein